MHPSLALVAAISFVAVALPADERHTHTGPSDVSEVDHLLSLTRSLLPPPPFSLPSLSVDRPKPIISLSSTDSGHGASDTKQPSQGSSFDLPPSMPGSAPTFSTTLQLPSSAQPSTPASVPPSSTTLAEPVTIPLPSDQSSSVQGGAPTTPVFSPLAGRAQPSSFDLPPSMPGSAPSFSTTLAPPAKRTSSRSAASPSDSSSNGTPVASGQSFNLPMPTPSSQPASLSAAFPTGGGPGPVQPSASEPFPTRGGPGPVKVSNSLEGGTGPEATGVADALEVHLAERFLVPDSLEWEDEDMLNEEDAAHVERRGQQGMHGGRGRHAHIHADDDEHYLDLDVEGIGDDDVEHSEPSDDAEGFIGLQFPTDPEAQHDDDDDLDDEEIAHRHHPKSNMATTTKAPAPTSSNCLAGYTGPRDSVSIRSWSLAHCRSTSMMTTMATVVMDDVTAGVTHGPLLD